MSDKLTPEELQKLQPFVSNLDGNIFVLRNLPEVVKGALFSRYSRSSLGVRKLLVQEFLPQVNQVLDGESEELAKQAVEFYDRVLDGYGDDSIGELGGAHLALENISILATKVIQDARIGGSPLEKSTRYVNFAKQINGDFPFYKPCKILQSDLQAQYLKVCRLLFETYQELFQQLFAKLCQYPSKQDFGQNSVKALERAARAKTYDLVRGLLPAATLTNMGVFGNGRFFETLLMKMQCSKLQEVQGIAQTSFLELNKTIPSFVRRADGSHRHFVSFQNFHEASQSLLQKFAERQGVVKAIVSEPQNDVKLIDYDANAEEKIIATLLFPKSHRSFHQVLEVAKSLSEQERIKLIEELKEARQDRRHKLPRALEMATYTFEIVADYGAYRDLHRHRTLTQERQLLSTHLGFETPSELTEPDVVNQYSDAMQFAGEVATQIAKELPEESQYVVPLGYRIRWVMQVNLRALCWLIELRSQPQGHTSYRFIAAEMYRQVAKAQPNLATFIKFVDLNEYELGRMSAEAKQHPL